MMTRNWLSICHSETKLDGVLQILQARREEDVVGARELYRHDIQLFSHEKRIAALE